MIPPMGRGHRGGTLSTSSRDSSSRGRSGAHSKPTAVEGPAAAMSAAKEPVAAREGPAAAREGLVAREEGPWRTRGLKE